MKFFQIEEFDCQHTGNNEMDPYFLERLDNLRLVCGFPFIITSGYRDPSHPIEAKKSKPGTHAQGIACDIKITNANQRYLLINRAISMEFRGIGVAPDFVHVDFRREPGVIWTY